MKKTTLSEWMSSNDVHALNISKLHSLKGGCGNSSNDAIPYATVTTDEETGDDEGCNGGPNDFIPPPGT
ncbi:MAG: hypothetical protein AB8B69_23040 [Chitinophagales bacterium]